MERPLYLYHYTSLDALALILKNKNFRFKPLSSLDDLLEGQCKDNANYADFVFTSSWTAEDQESIPMWKMYASPYSGVRIKLKIDPFKEDHIDFGDEPYFVANWDKNDFAVKVEYTNDNNVLYPHILEKLGNGYIHDTPKLGRYKNNAWTFQKEWRYLLFFAPVSFSDINHPQTFDIATKRYATKNYLPFHKIDLALDSTAFSEMVITLSPWVTEGNRDIVSCLVEKYSPMIKIQDSILEGKIR